jgi:hypothetical protein
MHLQVKLHFLIWELKIISLNFRDIHEQTLHAALKKKSNHGNQSLLFAPDTVQTILVWVEGTAATVRSVPYN